MRKAVVYNIRCLIMNNWRTAAIRPCAKGKENHKRGLIKYDE